MQQVTLSFGVEEMISYLEEKGYEIRVEGGTLPMKINRYVLFKDGESVWTYEDAMTTHECGLQRVFARELSTAILRR